MARHPIRLVVRDDLARSRLTTLFRLLLALPHLVWLALWSTAAVLAAVVTWVATLVSGAPPRELHAFLASYIRYSTHVGAYVYLAAGPFPGFTGRPGYPVDVEVDPPEPQRRWTVALRLLLVVPALLLGSVLTGGAGGLSGATAAAASGGGLAATAALLLWFAILVRGRASPGLRDAVTYALGYSAQLTGYLLVATDRYPSSDPGLVEPPQELPHHPVRLSLRDDLHRSRLTVLFRGLLALPHLVWLALWTVAVAVAAPVAWLAALVLGHLPLPFHRLLSAYVRYGAHVTAFLAVVGGPFPGFAGTQGSYPVDLETDAPERQRRLAILARPLLAVPALLVAGAYAGVAAVVAVLAWFAALVTGRVPEGMCRLGAVGIRYQAQAAAYALLVSGRYPYAAPALTAPQPAEQLDPPSVPVPALP
jgi:hypothetical protein